MKAQMPIVAEQMRRYQRALAKHQRGNLSSVGLAIAGRDLTKALSHIGIDATKAMALLQPAAPAATSQQQQP
jgi:hypothetical protein